MNDLPSTADRDTRQRGLVPPLRLARVNAVVIGVGAIGRQLALQLSAVGVRRMTLFDHDLVSVENLAPQGYWPENLGQTKVNATAEVCRRILPEMELAAIPERFRRNSARCFAHDGDVVVLGAVDAIATRQLVWESVRHCCRLFVDGRMSAEVIRVVAIDQPSTDRYYQSTLFAPADAYVGSCTERSTIYTASIAAGFMMAQLARWLRGRSVVPDQTLSLLAAELSVGDSEPIVG